VFALPPLPPLEVLPMNNTTIITWLSLSLVNLRGAHSMSINTINIIMTIIRHGLNMISKLPVDQRDELELPKNYLAALRHLGIKRDTFKRTLMCGQCATIHPLVEDSKGRPIVDKCVQQCTTQVFKTSKTNSKDYKVSCDHKLWHTAIADAGDHDSSSSDDEEDDQARKEEEQKRDRGLRIAVREEKRGGGGGAAAAAAAAVVVESSSALPAAVPVEAKSEPPPKREAIAMKPKMVYCHVTLVDVLQERFKLPHFVRDVLHVYTRPPVSLDLDRGIHLMDVYDAAIWRHFATADIIVDKKEQQVSLLQQATPFNIAFALCVDWFQPFGNTTHSTGVVQLIILNLPREVRYKKENIIVYSTIPGPTEPHSMMPIMKRLVDELLHLWHDGMDVMIHGQLHHIRCVLLSINCDLPASRKIAGHAGHSGRHGCARCTQVFERSAEFSKCIQHIEVKRAGKVETVVTYPLRTNEEHRAQAWTYEHEQSKSARKELRELYGTHETAFLALPYFDTVRQVLVDPLHNLWLGAARRFWVKACETKLVTPEQRGLMQRCIDTTQVPSDTIPRMPHKLTTKEPTSGFGQLIGREWQAWVLTYSLPAMAYADIDASLRKTWRFFVDACMLLSRPVVDEVAIFDAHKSFEKFHIGMQEIGEEWCTPNVHQLLHLAQMVRDYGPIAAFWGYGPERLNGVLGNVPHNNKDSETQLMRFMAEASQARQLITSLQWPVGVPRIETLSRDKRSSYMTDDSYDDQRQRRHMYNNNETLSGAGDQPGNGPICYSTSHRKYRLHRLSDADQKSLTAHLDLLYVDRAFHFAPFVHSYQGYHLAGHRFLARNGARKDTHSWAYCPHGKKDEYPVCIRAFYRINVYVSPDDNHPFDRDGNQRVGTECIKHDYAYVDWYSPLAMTPMLYFRFNPFPIQLHHLGTSQWVPLQNILGQLAIHKAHHNSEWSGMRLPLSTAY
jgi:hypothetical protein